MKLKITVRIFLFTFLTCLIRLNAIACNDVTGLNTTAITSVSATLNWNATACDSFLVRYFVYGTNEIHFRIVSPGTAVSLTIDSLFPNTTYHWLIHTYCNGGQSGAYQGTPGIFKTSAGHVSCISPNLLVTEDITNSSATMTWNSFIDADSFLVRHHLSGSPFFTWNYLPGMNHNLALNGLMPSSIYEWDVRSICNGVILPSHFTDTFVTNCDTLPVPDHVLICILENKGYLQIIDSLAIAPYINALANDSMSALFTESYGLEHPSQPNYLDLFSGSNQGVTTNNLPSSHFTTPNLARELLDAGKTFVTYSENLPYTGSDTIRSGNYERKHNPVANWMGTGINQVPDTCNQPFSNFPVDYNLLPTVSYVVPDQSHDMHNGTIAAGDAWVAANLDAYVQWAKTHNSLFILTFDEDNHNYNNKVVTIFNGSMVRSGQYQKYMNHYSLLRTLEDMYVLEHAGHSGSVESVKECWLSDFTGVESFHQPVYDWTVYGYAVTGELNVDFTLSANAVVSIEVFSSDGKLVAEQLQSPCPAGIHRMILNTRDKLSDGIYIVQLTINHERISKKVMMDY